jgi:hypothetical protein
VNITYYKSQQVRHLYDGNDIEYINEIVQLSEQKSKRYGKKFDLVLWQDCIT